MGVKKHFVYILQLWLKMPKLYLTCQPHCKLTSYLLLVVVWQELCTIHPVQIPPDAKKQTPSKPAVSQILRHCVQLQRPEGVTDT